MPQLAPVTTHTLPLRLVLVNTRRPVSVRVALSVRATSHRLSAESSGRRRKSVTMKGKPRMTVRPMLRASSIGSRSIERQNFGVLLARIVRGDTMTPAHRV